MSKKTKKKPVWKGQKRNAVGLPFTFTKYILYDNKLVIRKGFLNIIEDEVELYKVKDKQLKISLLGRIFNYGTISIYASDVYNCDNVLKNVHKVRMVAGLIEQYVNIERDKYNVRGRDMVGESGIRPGEVDSDGNGIPDILENQECDCECHDGCK